MPRIAVISEHASPLALLGGVDSGGQNVYVAEIARQLGQNGFEVDIFTRRDTATLPSIVHYAENVRVIHINAGPAIPVRKEMLLPFMDDFAKEMIRFMLDSHHDYELVHANFFMSGYVAMIIRQTLNIPFVVTFHALGKVRSIYQGSQDEFPAARQAIEKQVMEEASAIIAECPQDKVDMISLYKAQAYKIVIIPCGINPDDFYPVPQQEARARLGLARDDRIVLQLGRLVPRKGIETTIRGFAELIHRHKVAARLIIVGGDTQHADSSLTPEIGRLSKIAAECGVDDHVRFLGAHPRHELRYFYSAADAFISTPWYEPFGITPLEAMACGTPVIGSKVGGIKFTVNEGKTGFLVHPHDPAAVGKKLATLFNDEHMLQQMAQNSVQHVNRHFTWAMVCKELSLLYKKVKPSRFASYKLKRMRQTALNTDPNLVT